MTGHLLSQGICKDRRFTLEMCNLGFAEISLIGMDVSEDVSAVPNVFEVASEHNQ